MTRDDLLGFLSNDNVQAFLRVIRAGESSNDDSAYTILNGGEQFQAPPWEHPNRVGKGGTSTAAGAYQLVIKTWRNLQQQYGLEDFSPINQDCAAVALIVQHGAMDLVLAGRPDEAIRRINSKWVEWECFQNPRFFIQVPQLFAAYGGREASAGPVSQPDGSSPSPKVGHIDQKVDQSMAPLVLPLLEIASGLIPQLGKLFGSGSEVSNRNIAAAQVVADSLVKATDAVNLQDAVEKIQNDPQARQNATQAVADVMGLGDVGGGIPAAREASKASEGDWRKVFVSVPMVVIFMLMPIVYFVVYHVITGQDWSAEIKASVVSAVISGVLFAIVGFALGTSYGSQKKDAALGVK